MREGLQVTGFVTRKAQARGLASGAMNPQVGDIPGPLHQMRLQRREALEGARPATALHFT